MKAVIGIYDASLGAKSNETSGIAIARRDAQGDTGTYVYHDNFALAIERTGEIINELFPKIYDTQRTVQILGDDGKPDMVEINKPQMVDGVSKVLHDMTSGSYDVVMEQGPSFATKREFAQAAMTEFIRAFPPAAPVMGDIYARNMDWPQAEEIGERLEELCRLRSRPSFRPTARSASRPQGRAHRQSRSRRLRLSRPLSSRRSRPRPCRWQRHRPRSRGAGQGRQGQG
jgi:hypothetical protein